MREIAIESLLDDLFEKLGRDPGKEEEEAFLSEDRIQCRIEYLLGRS